MFSWRMLGRGSSSAASLLTRIEKGIFLPSPLWTYPAWVAVVALAVTGLVSISKNAAVANLTDKRQTLPSKNFVTTNQTYEEVTHVLDCLFRKAEAKHELVAKSYDFLTTKINAKDFRILSDISNYFHPSLSIKLEFLMKSKCWQSINAVC